ncbi:hypothetical protein SAMN05444144_107166 [Flavobacterium akiainvivens]|nr:hypothetical protein SAMN05444144_107166 [Flavobacterium akiainvivens]
MMFFNHNEHKDLHKGHKSDYLYKDHKALWSLRVKNLVFLV